MKFWAILILVLITITFYFLLRISEDYNAHDIEKGKLFVEMMKLNPPQPRSPKL